MNSELKTNWRCRLFGHTGKQTESGWHVCDRCGLHEYHCSDDYLKCAAIWTPWHWTRRQFDRLMAPSRTRRAIRRMLDREDDGMPF